MKNDLISIDGNIIPFSDSGFAPDDLLSANFIYQKIHTLAHRPMHAQWIAEIAEMSCRALYGYSSEITAKLIDKEVGALLSVNRYPLSASTLVTLYLIPDNGRWVRMMSCQKQLVYSGYALTTGVTCAVVPYDYPFPQHKTAVSLASHTYGAGYAIRNGFGGAIAENAEGVMTGLGENPIFAIAGNKALTPPMENGAADSVERRLGITVCEDAGLVVGEYPISSADILDFDEIFSVTPQGVTSIRQINNRLLPHSMAKNILEILKNIPSDISLNGGGR